MKAANVERYRTPILAFMGISLLSLLQLSGSAFWVSAFVLLSCGFGAFFTYWLARYAIMQTYSSRMNYIVLLLAIVFRRYSYIFEKDDGTPEMRAVSDPIKEGAEGFLKVQYAAIMKMAVILCFIILGSYALRPSGGSEKGVESLGNGMLGFLASLSFVAGAACSAFVGYLSMWVSASANVRVCSCARRSYIEALETCFRGGAFSAVLCITLCVFGVSMLFLILHFFFVTNGSTLTATGNINLDLSRILQYYIITHVKITL